MDGAEGDGDVYRPDNLLEFQKFVLENTDQQGVHFLMADGVSVTRLTLTVLFRSLVDQLEMLLIYPALHQQ